MCKCTDVNMFMPGTLTTLDVNTYNANAVLNRAAFVHAYLTPLYMYTCMLPSWLYSVIVRLILKHHMVAVVGSLELL